MSHNGFNWLRDSLIKFSIAKYSEDPDRSNEIKNSLCFIVSRTIGNKCK